MAFGDRPAREIRNVIAEPHWGGERVLVKIVRGDVTLRDVDGDAVPGFAEVRDALAEAARAGDLLLDGYLVAGRLQQRAGHEHPLGVESVPTVTQMARQMILGGGGRNPRQEAYEQAARRRQPLPDAETSFVGMDLLWLDGEPLIGLPLQERRRLLESVMADGELVQRNVIVRPPVEAWYAQWKALGFQEFAVKDANSRYTPGGVSRDWTITRIPKR